MAEACGRCGTRADIGCKHRAAEGAPPLAIADPRVKRHKNSEPKPVGQGFAAFHKPTKRDFDALVAGVFKK